MTLNRYYTQLTRAWQQIDVFEVHQWHCALDYKLYKSITKTNRAFRYLTRLHPYFDSVRSRILNTKLLYSLVAAFFEINMKKTERKL